MNVSTFTKPRWTARDSICLGLAVFVVINVIMCLWVAVTSMSTAHRQATAVFFVLKNAPAIEFNLNTESLNVTGRLQPRHSECSHRLHFDGHMTATTSNTSEEFVLFNHRGYRYPLGTSQTNATCLTTQDLPPLHTVADTVHSAFQPHMYSAFNVRCKPLQFTFYDEPFVVSKSRGAEPWLVIRGKRCALELNVLSSSDAVDNPQFPRLDHCEYLEAPMTSGESCHIKSIKPLRCPNPHIDACRAGRFTR
ncbi:hypothetical protein PHMEG_00023293 [Phytophthora megakarya]|uniref:Uncharacterized protein n=1 Tax=Phytophthora megakarya TaxID=4795 RepID=A0A225VI21_9STRA|nr:hypothetical protein PHMEG_00023293 [Phytophthora megakarya]